MNKKIKDFITDEIEQIIKDSLGGTMYLEYEVISIKIVEFLNNNYNIEKRPNTV